MPTIAYCWSIGSQKTNGKSRGGDTFRGECRHQSAFLASSVFPSSGSSSTAALLSRAFEWSISCKKRRVSWKRQRFWRGGHLIYLFEVPVLKGQSLSEQMTEKGDDSTQSDSLWRQPASKGFLPLATCMINQIICTPNELVLNTLLFGRAPWKFLLEENIIVQRLAWKITKPAIYDHGHILIVS